MAHEDELEAVDGDVTPDMIVITYQSPRGRGISLTTRQVLALQRAHLWPRDAHGEEYCCVAEGAHRGRPTWSPDAFAELIDQMARAEEIAR